MSGTQLVYLNNTVFEKQWQKDLVALAKAHNPDLVSMFVPISMGKSEQEKLREIAERLEMNAEPKMSCIEPFKWERHYEAKRPWVVKVDGVVLTGKKGWRTFASQSNAIKAAQAHLKKVRAAQRECGEEVKTEQ